MELADSPVSAQVGSPVSLAVGQAAPEPAAPVAARAFAAEPACSQDAAQVAERACTQAVVAVCSLAQQPVWFRAAAAAVRVLAELLDGSQPVVAAPLGEFLVDSRVPDELPALDDSPAESVPVSPALARPEASPQVPCDRWEEGELQPGSPAGRGSLKPIAGGSRLPPGHEIPAPAAPRCAARDMPRSPQAKDERLFRHDRRYSSPAYC